MTLKNFLTIAAKNAVNALLVNTSLMATYHSQFYLTGNWQGIIHMLKVTGGVVAAREILVWGPILLKWSSTNADPSALDVASAEAGKAVQHAQKAQDAITEAKAVPPEQKP
jgi:hypothetical protein